MLHRKIAIFLPSLRGGGAERVIVNLLHGFSATGADVDLVLAKAVGPYLDQVPLGVRVIDLKSNRVIKALPSLICYLKKEKPISLLSVMDHCNIVASLAKIVSNVPVKLVLSVHNTLSQESKNSHNIKNKILFFLRSFFYSKSDMIVCVSQGVKDDLHALIRVPKEKISVIYNPVITDQLFKLSNEKANHPFFSNDSFKVVIGVGRLTKQKNFSGLIKAFCKVKLKCNARLIILGEGEERDSLQELINELGLNNDVCLYGFANNPYQLIASSDVFVLSSIFEGLPTVLIEALALGIPVVSTDCKSGPREILNYVESGVLIKVGDVDGMANAIIDTLININSKQNLRKQLEPFTIDYATKKYIEVLT